MHEVKKDAWNIYSGDVAVCYTEYDEYSFAHIRAAGSWYLCNTLKFRGKGRTLQATSVATDVLRSFWYFQGHPPYARWLSVVRSIWARKKNWVFHLEQ